ncbi:MAG: nitroreductase family protein [Candidatus Bathyarchaeota archaeon]
MGKNHTYEKIRKRRTIRKYLQKAVQEKALIKCVDAARLSPSGRNRQPLRYVIVNDPKLLKQVFTTLNWAVDLPDYFPTEEEMPRAYIVLLLDKSGRTPVHDASIASMSISMVAYDEGLGSCILASVNRKRLRRILDVPESLAIELVVALGYPAENPVIDTVKDGDTNYWLDQNGILHVPKWDLKDMVQWNKYEKE